MPIEVNRAKQQTGVRWRTRFVKKNPARGAAVASFSSARMQAMQVDLGSIIHLEDNRKCYQFPLGALL